MAARQVLDANAWNIAWAEVTIRPHAEPRPPARALVSPPPPGTPPSAGAELAGGAAGLLRRRHHVRRVPQRDQPTGVVGRLLCCRRGHGGRARLRHTRVPLLRQVGGCAGAPAAASGSAKPSQLAHAYEPTPCPPFAGTTRPPRTTTCGRCISTTAGPWPSRRCCWLQICRSRPCRPCCRAGTCRRWPRRCCPSRASCRRASRCVRSGRGVAAK